MALRKFIMNQYLMEYVGEWTTDEEVNQKVDQGYTAAYSLAVQDPAEKATHGSHAIDAQKKGNLAAFVNHSCEPNACYVFVSNA